MKKLIYLLGLVMLISGCAATSKYTPYTQDKFQPKNADYPIEIFKEGPKPHRNHKIIGRIEVHGSTMDGISWEDIYRKMLQVAREKGADAIINYKSDYREYSGKFRMPGHTSYQAQTTYHRGSMSGTTTYDYGRGYASSSGTYSGVSTTNIPIYHPGYDIPYSGAILYSYGELVVFLDKKVFDKFAESGIYKRIINLYPVGIPDLEELIKNFTIAEVTPDSPFERAGIQKEDIIKRVNDKEFKNYHIQDMLDYLDNLPSDKEIKFEIARGNVNKIFYVKPSTKEPHLGFTFKADKDKFYIKREARERPPMASVVFDKIRFFLSLQLYKEGVIDCEVIVRNESDKEFRLLPKHIRALTNTIPLERLSVKELIDLVDIEGKYSEGDTRRKEIQAFEKVVLKESVVLPGESINKKMWFLNELLSPNIEVKIELDDKRKERIEFDVLQQQQGQAPSTDQTARTRSR